MTFPCIIFLFLFVDFSSFSEVRENRSLRLAALVAGAAALSSSILLSVPQLIWRIGAAADGN